LGATSDDATWTTEAEKLVNWEMVIDGLQIDTFVENASTCIYRIFDTSLTYVPTLGYDLHEETDTALKTLILTDFLAELANTVWFCNDAMRNGYVYALAEKESFETFTKWIAAFF
jgi:hypothetical protein